MTQADKPLVVIAAVAANEVIGAGGKMPWRSKEELRHFAATTMGETLVMGRKTYASIGKALPGRMSIVVTRDRSLHLPGCEMRASVPEALAAASQRPGRKVFIIGGAEIYAQTIDQADELIISRMHLRPEGDAHFPTIDPELWEQTSSRQVDASPAFDIVSYKRRATAA